MSLTSCSIMTITPDMYNVKAARVGDVFFEYKDFSFKYELTVTSLNDKEIGLLYNEFTTEHLFTWLIKQGFNKTFTYQLSDKKIPFKEFEFEIISVESGVITYKRIK